MKQNRYHNFTKPTQVQRQVRSVSTHSIHYQHQLGLALGCTGAIWAHKAAIVLQRKECAGSGGTNRESSKQVIQASEFSMVLREATIMDC